MKNKVKIVWKKAKNVSEEEINRRIEHAYDILFNAMEEKTLEEKKER